MNRYRCSVSKKFDGANNRGRKCTKKNHCSVGLKHASTHCVQIHCWIEQVVVNLELFIQNTLEIHVAQE